MSIAIIGIMVDIKSTSPGHDLIFDVPLRKYIEELEWTNADYMLLLVEQGNQLK